MKRSGVLLVLTFLLTAAFVMAGGEKEPEAASTSSYGELKVGVDPRQLRDE